MKMFTTEEMGKFIYDKIVDGWFVLETDIEIQKKFEEGFYTPGTPKNNDFEVLFVRYGGKVSTICIAKLTKDLQDYMKVSDKEFNKILLIELSQERVGYIFNYIAAINKKARGDFIYNYLNDLLELMEKGKVTREPIHTAPKKQRSKSKRKAISKSIRHEVFKRDNYCCVECNASKEDGTVLHIDHIIPVSQGGSDELDNLQTLCQDCNLAKSNRAWKGGV
jgi:hypothetical protein